MKQMGNILLAVVILALMFSISMAAKKPGPESIFENNYTPPVDRYNLPLESKTADDGIYRRLYYPRFESAATASEARANEFLAQYKETLGISNIATDLRLLSSKQSLSGDHYRYQQYYNDIPVFASQVLINITRTGTISSVVSDYVANINSPTSPALQSDQAIQAASRAMGIIELRDATQTELVIFPNNGHPRLAWKVLLLAQEPLGDWQVFVDAISGEIIDRKNIRELFDRLKIHGSKNR